MRTGQPEGWATGGSCPPAGVGTENRESGGDGYPFRLVPTNVYVDGFNLYYGCLRGTPHKWLDLDALCRRLFPRDRINRIRYFTAIVSARPGDPQQPQRQQAYLRALETIPLLTIHRGRYLTHPTRMLLAHPVPGGPVTVEVIKTEEKGSDVNLATYLLFDAFRKDCDTAVVISNDSDLKEPIELVQRELGVRVGVVNSPSGTPESSFAAGILPANSGEGSSGVPICSRTSRRPRADSQAGELVSTAWNAKTRRSGPCTQPPKRLGGYLDDTRCGAKPARFGQRVGGAAHGRRSG
jgi:uncharacterized LabA/DUF88 family protein